MREIKLGDEEIRVRATPLALLFYKQEFRSDLIGDLIKLQDVKKDMSKFDSIAMLQLIWAMAKADKFGKVFPSFEKWIGGLKSIDLGDKGFVVAALEEATNGFFRSGAKGNQRK